MPRLKIEVDRRYFVPLPRDAELLNADRFLRAVRLVRSGDLKSFFDPRTGRTGAYGFTLKEWNRTASPYAHVTEPKAIESICYRWFIRCWHEVLLAGLEVDPYRVAVLWQWGPVSGLNRLKRGKCPLFASKVHQIYYEIQEH